MLNLRTLSLFLATLAVGAQLHAEPARQLSRSVLRDKIRGAWAAQMIGVSYGAPTEFKTVGKTIEGEIKGDPLSNAIDQDDLYVEMTFARVMDSKGLDATTADYGDAFKETKYKLWHANAAARRNLNRGITAPMSGHPTYNLHADDIDFQIEADFIGIMCPGLPQASNAFCDRVGRVMNYGDGLYGGMFIAGMYSAAYFETDPRKVVEAGLACIPADSPYGQIIADTLAWSAEEPDDWRKVWQKLEDKWDKHDVCPNGVHRPFNIDAKLNGAYVAMGLLYGHGDWQQTMEVSTRCGQDSDCNPASALGVLGAMLGFDKLPSSDQEEMTKLADTKFSHTDYSFNDIVKSTETRALEVIRRAGGTVTDTEVTIPPQSAEPPQLELWNFGIPTKVWKANDPAWKWTGKWRDVKDRQNAPAKVTNVPGSEATLRFNGTGLALMGNLSEAGGRADVYIDGVKSDLVADNYIVPNTIDDDLWRVYGLAPGEHTVRVVVRKDADPNSKGRRMLLLSAITYQTTHADEAPAK
ncbi:ADP-ribosylglycohydrolase family protein [Lacipirellula sp.]|uniref:ADP-ribosylglycohydrolase family protein n=1 Tax=Lacipirellula sp. TaxID=2691419 RepID=UPI003D0A01A0